MDSDLPAVPMPSVTLVHNPSTQSWQSSPGKEVLWSARAFQDFSWHGSILERKLGGETGLKSRDVAKQRQKSHGKVVCSVGYSVAMMERLECCQENWNRLWWPDQLMRGVS